MVDTSKGAGQHPWAVSARALMDAATATSGAAYHRKARTQTGERAARGIAAPASVIAADTHH